MTGCFHKLCAAMLGIATLVLPAFAQTPLGTSFTYQGRLEQSGAMVDANADIQFKLFNATTGGAQIGTTQLASNVAVVDGLFTVAIDFGPAAFNSNARFLEIAVRSPAGSGSFVTLSPRQPITAAPFASRATSAFALDAPDGSPASAVFVDNNGNVGIGTTAPTALLDLAGSQEALKIRGPEPIITLNDTASNDMRVLLQNAGGRYFVVSESFLNGSNPGGFTMVDSEGRLAVGNFNPVGPLDVRSPSGSLILTSTGNVGIGTGTPQSRLDVRGDIRLGAAGQLFAPAGEENLRIVRGFIGGGGDILRGSGFHVTHPVRGSFNVTFNTPFAGPPVVTAMCNHEANSSLVTAVVSAAAADFRVRWAEDQDVTLDTGFNFIAIGPR